MKRLLAALFACALLATPALAHHKEGHDNGPPTVSSEDKGSKGGGGPAHESGDSDDNKHPSGKDRETNDGPTDDTQGNSPSDPDDDGRGPDRSNGGADKPGGPGGVDRDDQDGNNGCGNDDDFEDDNEGRCGGRPDRDKCSPGKNPCSTPSPSSSPSPTVGHSPSPTVTPTGRPSPSGSPSDSSTPGDSETPGRPGGSGESERDEPGPLPFTGANLPTFIALAIILIIIGWILSSLLRNRGV